MAGPPGCDVVSGALSAHIPREDQVSARLTLTLLRDAIRHKPEKLTTVLHEVASLKSDDLDALTPGSITPQPSWASACTLTRWT